MSGRHRQTRSSTSNHKDQRRKRDGVYTEHIRGYRETTRQGEDVKESKIEEGRGKGDRDIEQELRHRTERETTKKRKPYRVVYGTHIRVQGDGTRHG